MEVGIYEADYINARNGDRMFCRHVADKRSESTDSNNDQKGTADRRLSGWQHMTEADCVAVAADGY